MLSVETMMNTTDDGVVICPHCRKKMLDDPKIWNTEGWKWPPSYEGDESTHGGTIVCPHCEKIFGVERYPGERWR
jgi:hypothetical protein